MSKEVKTAKELEAFVLADLRRQRGCEGAESIRVVPIDRHKGTWTVRFKEGTASRGNCQSALDLILASWQERYDLEA